MNFGGQGHFLFKLIINRVFKMLRAQGLVDSQKQDRVDISRIWLWRWDWWLVGIWKCIRMCVRWLLKVNHELLNLQKWVNFWTRVLFIFLLEYFLKCFICSWCGPQSNCSMVVRNYCKPEYKNSFTESILRVH